ncbi:Plasmid recombination enzyme [Pseudomonas extremaustralis]|uniref:MobV family relaxase n=1 Tax=Pseudomonas extremaustralis TaxID=359110 RepID=UPI00099C24C1|nr:MobV family relaxase [Pseudomonas extremaustralis]SKB04816.1 Plasmid recombination enzyme [Pseudomonas extremaustralis]
MSYAILRAKKLKSLGAVARSARHTFREQPTPNADPAQLSRNRTVGAQGADSLLQVMKGRLPEKRRRDAVLCIEYLITASPEAFRRHGGRLDDLGGGYFSEAVAWLKKRHGAENVVSSTVHLDESTPHLVAYVVPLTKDGRLSCRDFLGGPTKLRQMQDEFQATCGASRGLERGVKGSNAKHEEVAAFYEMLRAAGAAPQLGFKDYAAAAFGKKTKLWIEAETVARANALCAAREPRIRKATRSRRRGLEQTAKELDLKQQVAAHRDIEHAMQEFNLEQRSIALAAREIEIRAAAGRLLSLEGERDALERRLNMLENRKTIESQAHRRARTYEDSPSLG